MAKTQAASPRQSNWKGGGGFRYYRLAPSLLEKDKWGNWVINKKYNAAMLAEALCKLEGFTYAPSDAVYWQHGHSTERDFIYVTTQALSHEQLQQLSDEVGPERSTAGALHGLPRHGGALSESHREEDPQASALPLRMGPRRLQPEGGEPAQGAADQEPESARALFELEGESHEPPRQCHRRPPESAPAPAPVAGNPGSHHGDRAAKEGQRP